MMQPFTNLIDIDKFLLEVCTKEEVEVPPEYSKDRQTLSRLVSQLTYCRVMFRKNSILEKNDPILTILSLLLINGMRYDILKCVTDNERLRKARSYQKKIEGETSGSGTVDWSRFIKENLEKKKEYLVCGFIMWLDNCRRTHNMKHKDPLERFIKDYQQAKKEKYSEDRVDRG